jgi:hypothetical protein
MSQFSVGSRVRVIGGLAEYYKGLKVIVLDVTLDDRGLVHLNRYRVLIAERLEETFYQFQLAAIQNVACEGSEHRGKLGRKL